MAKVLVHTYMLSQSLSEVGTLCIDLLSVYSRTCLEIFIEIHI